MFERLRLRLTQTKIQHLKRRIESLDHYIDYPGLRGFDLMEPFYKLEDPVDLMRRAGVLKIRLAKLEAAI
jgi:hypothetical protein